MNLDQVYTVSTGSEKFFREMKAFAHRRGRQAPYVPFATCYLTYDSMNAAQRAWYFYWRTQVRAGQYPDTDLAYLLICFEELLSGVVWQTPQEGQEQMLALWSAYRERMPAMDDYLMIWMFDFARQYHLDYRVPAGCPLCRPLPSVRTDLLIDAHTSDVPLKLPFELIVSLSDCQMLSSKFYLSGYQQLMREAIPRVVALADAALRKQGKRGILATYAPNRTRKQDLFAYSGAICPGARRYEEVHVKAYTSSVRLRNYISGLIRYSENTLRGLYGFRGRLRGIMPDEQTAAMIHDFLCREYGRARKSADPLTEKIAAQGIRYVDRRGKDGCLWIMGGHELDPFVRAMEAEGVRFTFKAGGGQTVQGDAWWTKDQLPPSRQAAGQAKQRIKLDFDSIDALREQSDQVRDALRVEENQPAKPPLTELKEVAAIYRAIDDEGRCLLSRLRETQWEMPFSDAPDTVESVNRQARYALGCSLLYMEQDRLVAEEDYRDELEEVLSHPPELPPPPLDAGDDPSGSLKAWFCALEDDQRKTLKILLQSSNVSSELAQLAESSLTLPQMLIEDLNEAALRDLGEILVDTLGDTPRIPEEYAMPLTNIITQEG